MLLLLLRASGLRFSERSSYCKYVPDPTRITSGADMSWLYLDNNCVFSIEQCFWVLLVQAVGWMLAAVYFDNVQPNKHGVRMPYWYPLSPSYWGQLLSAAGSSLRPRRRSLSFGGVARRGGAASMGGKQQHASPFAVPDAARKVAKSIADVKGEEQLVVRCSSSAGGMLEAVHGRASGALQQHGSLASAARQSVSSGFLRRRDNRNSASGVPDGTTTGSSGRDSYGGELAAMPSRSNGPVSTVGRLPQFSAQHSTHLVINSSVTALRLSESSSEATTVRGHTGHGMEHATTGAAAAAGAAAAGLTAGTTISLHQYQAMQAERRSRRRRWWHVWGSGGDDSHMLAAKKHDAASGAKQQHQDSAPVVLDAGVLQEEQRMKTVLFGGESGCTCVLVRLPCAVLLTLLCPALLLLQRRRLAGLQSRTWCRCSGCARCTSCRPRGGGGSSGSAAAAATAASSSSRRRGSTWLWQTAGLACPRASCCACWGRMVSKRGGWVEGRGLAAVWFQALCSGWC